jgi:multidrug resistance efflux pump
MEARMRPLNIVIVIVALSAGATIPSQGEETPAQRSDRPRARRTAAALEQRVAALEKEVEALRAEIAVLKGQPASTAPPGEIKVIRLKHSSADASAKFVQDLFSLERGSQIVAVADTVTNSVILSSPTERMPVIEALLLDLDRSAGDSMISLRFAPEKHLELRAAELKARVAQAEADVQARQEKLERTERLVDKGFATKLQFEAEQAALKAAETVLEQARRGLDALSSETSPETKQPE